MSAGPLIIEIISLFFIVLYLLNKYSDLRQQNKITLIATFIAWYFSFMIIILLPMDISLVLDYFFKIPAWSVEWESDEIR